MLTMATEKPINIKVSEDGRRNLRLIAAMTGETMMDVINRLTQAELERLEKEKHTPKKKQS